MMDERPLENKDAKRTVPPPSRCQVWIDFDGTISQKDVLDELIGRYSIDDSWEIAEQQWQAGLIGSKKCLEIQFSLLRISKAELENVLDGIELDDGFLPLLEIFSSLSIPVTVISDCVDFFIKRILERHGITDISVRSNTAVHRGLRLELQCPHSSTQCSSAAAHCKCSSITALGKAGRKSIYIGDGLSDLCAAKKMDFVFAKNALARRLEQESIGFVKYSNLNDVADFLSRAWQRSAVLKEQR
jgi:2-hydroxy-3-keto-5-methylthiopentenyl-1-phosphate phosphatase